MGRTRNALAIALAAALLIAAPAAGDDEEHMPLITVMTESEWDVRVASALSVKITAP